MPTPKIFTSDPGGGKARDWAQQAGRAVHFLRPQSLLSVFFLCALTLLLLCYATCTTYVKPDEFAVRQVDVAVPLLTGATGIHSNIYDTGIHWAIPGCEKYIRFPKSVRVVTMHSSKRTEEPVGKAVRYEDAAHIQTSDGFFIDLDVSILYRVTDPYEVVKEFGAGVLYEQNGIIVQVEPTLKATMGTLNPEDFFDSKKRVAKQEEARDKFNEFLTPKGLKVDHVLIRYPQYHEAVQARIEARNIQEQTRSKNIEEAKLAQAQAALQEVLKQGEANLTIKLMEGSNYLTRLTAQMESYERKKKSQADLITSLAEAEKQKAINEAYEGQGSERLVGLQWAKVLSGLDTIILPAGGENGFNPLDLDKIMKQLQIKKKE